MIRSIEEEFDIIDAGNRRVYIRRRIDPPVEVGKRVEVVQLYVVNCFLTKVKLSDDLCDRNI